MAEEQLLLSGDSPWSGGVSPFGVKWNKLMMWMFIITDALIFAGLLASYGFARLASDRWPDPAEIFHLSFLALMTFILISSSATMASAVGAARECHWTAATRFVLLTILGGLAFLGCQAYEWASLIGEGARLSSNPWGVVPFGSYFFVLTGFHGTHVLSGVVVLAITAFRSATGRSSADGIEVAGLYWHFVDLVWVFIFTLFYLI
ncbi:MAG: cytochrome c oxidase subunit 3 [Acidobacteria bacterium]|nr:cytochrome c oxidase subunit 3 [Acidobacteriota bacterium]